MTAMENPNTFKFASTHFNWKYAKEGKDRGFSKLASQLECVRPLKYGHLYRHKKREQFWYLDDDEIHMSRIQKGDLDNLLEWDSRELTLSSEQVNILSSIGATEADNDGNGRGVFKIPCAVTNRSGQVLDPCLIKISKQPPYIQSEKSVLLGNKVNEIAPTSYALQSNVRVATYKAEELRMGFAPTFVKTIEGQLFILNWTMDIFFYDGIQGKDIELSREDHSLDAVAPIIGLSDVSFVNIYIDWYEGCESLLINMPQSA